MAVVTVTDAAALRARALLDRHGLSAGGLRVRVQSAGCEGFVAVLDLAGAQLAEEVSIDANGVRLFVDVASMGKLPGAVLDHQETANGAEFVWAHGGACATCICGTPEKSS